MRDGFIKVAAGTPKIRVADCGCNAKNIIELMKEAAEKGVKVLALHELCITGYTCGDLFLQQQAVQLRGGHQPGEDHRPDPQGPRTQLRGVL